MEGVRTNMLNQLREEYKRIYSKRHNLLLQLTDREKTIFIKLSNELQLNQENLPGFFFIDYPHSYLLKTPSYVWVLWLYHRFIHHQTRKMGNSYPRLSLDQIYKDMCVLIKNNYFSLNEKCEEKQLKHLIVECINEYKKIGAIVDVNKGVKELRYDQIPLFTQIDSNIYIEMFYNFILPELNYQFNFQNETVPSNIKKVVYFFQNEWANSYNGYCIKDQFKWANQQQSNVNKHVVIYADQNVLETAINYLTDKQKKAIAAYLKNNNARSSQEVCELLIKDFHMNAEKDNNGIYKIYPYVDEYVFSSLWLWN